VGEFTKSSSYTPPNSLLDHSESVQHSPSINDGLTLEQSEIVADVLTSNQEPPNGRVATQSNTLGEDQKTDKPVEDSALPKGQETNISTQEDKVVIEDLEVEILEAIGKRVAEDRVLAPPIPKSIAIRLEDILKKGLSKEEREKLIKEHTPPQNCTLIDPPKLNEEIKVSILETSTKRDDRIIEKQKKITACLALMGSTIVDIINNNKTEKENSKLSSTHIALIKKISEAARLLADLQRDETLTRRSLVIAVINSSQKEVLESSTADEWLFGPKLGDRLRAAKSIERSGKDLKANPKNTKKSKNFKTPSRRQPFKFKTSGEYRNKTFSRNYPNKKKWGSSGESRSSSQSQTPAQQKKT